ncbi:DUF2993 domain-containing protein [Pantanalinema rosaneae CENA516]|uniref:LmeA family phospholipid-binding protein n=1 Tax=Pantanalinema rosaneae TaxID=1620701 RepID=UPI003D6EC6A4
MDILTIVLSSLLGLVSPVGVVTDQVVAATIRDQLDSVEELRVRIDNAPNYDIVQGKADRIRIAGRGVFPLKDLRLAVVELETDPVNLNRRRLQRGRLRLQEPFRAGVRLVVTEADINQALRSPNVLKRLQRLARQFLGSQAGDYTIQNSQVEFLANQRVRLQTELQSMGSPDRLAIEVESGLDIVAGRQLRLLQPTVQLNGTAVPEAIVIAVTDRLPSMLDLQQLEASGITARVLQFKLDDNQAELAAFVQVTPESK